MESNASKARRLANVLKRYSEDKAVVEKIARELNYIPSELEKDMKAIEQYIDELEADKFD